MDLCDVYSSCIDTQAKIAGAHHTAIDDLLAFMKRELAATRAGEAGRDGAVAHVEVTGLIAAAFDHLDSRASDPQLHTHVVVSDKVRTVFDGKWRSLDGRPVHAATVALADELSPVKRLLEARAVRRRLPALRRPDDRDVVPRRRAGGGGRRRRDLEAMHFGHARAAGASATDGSPRVAPR